jgi:hypothetical protein
MCRRTVLSIDKEATSNRRNKIRASFCGRNEDRSKREQIQLCLGKSSHEVYGTVMQQA